MKKRILSLLLVSLLLLPCLNVGATAQYITLNGETLAIPEEMGAIKEQDDRTFVPVRFVCENLGCTINYNEVQSSATITDSFNVSYLVAENSSSLFVLPSVGTPLLYTMDTTTFIDHEIGRMYVPIRFLATAMGYTVDWDEETKTVSLTKNEVVDNTEVIEDVVDPENDENVEVAE